MMTLENDNLVSLGKQQREKSVAKSEVEWHRLGALKLRG